MHVLRTIQRYALIGPIPVLYYFLRYGAMVSMSSKVQVTSRIRFGRGCVVKPFAVIKTTQGRIVFGRHCAVSCFDQIDSGNADIIIGDYVRIGPHVYMGGARRKVAERRRLIVDQGHDHPGLRVGNDVLVGAGAVIMAGVTVGDGAVIGAGAVVNRDVLPYAIVAGVPAEIIGERK